MLVFNRVEMQKVDKLSITEFGVSGVVLMEHAALAARNEILKMVKPAGKICIVAGTGNNGGDGLCLARLLSNDGYKVLVYMLGDFDKHTELSKLQLKSLISLGVEVASLPSQEKSKNNIQADLLISEFKNSLSKQDLIVDAIIGIACKRNLEGLIKKAVELMNKSLVKILALDIPTGIDANTGQILGTAIRADKTVSFCRPKLGNILYPGAQYTGELHVADIGTPMKAIEQIENPYEILDDKMFENIFDRAENSHKGSFGKLLAISGSFEMAGAALLTCEAAYRAGTGLVNLITRRENREYILSNLPEAIVSTYTENTDLQAMSELLREKIEASSCVLIGPGLGTGRLAKSMLRVCIESNKPLIIDADGLNILSENPSFLLSLRERKAPTILSPHIGEMARLCECSTEDILKSPLSYALRYSKMKNSIVILKSSRTVIAAPNSKVYINTKSNSAMATAGTGDVLTGILGAVIAQNKASVVKACAYAVHLHAKCGEKAREKRTERSTLASDLILEL